MALLRMPNGFIFGGFGVLKLTLNLRTLCARGMFFIKKQSRAKGTRDC
jgi:hypothetical protein